MIKLHLIGSKTSAQIAAHAALMKAWQEAFDAAGPPVDINTPEKRAQVAADQEGRAPKPIPPTPTPPVLRFYGFSGRGVMIRLLDTAERDSVAAIAAKEVGEDSTSLEFQTRRNRDWVCRALAEVTKERDLDEAGLAKATWIKVTQQQLEADGGATSAKTLFTSKDMDLLVGWFLENHLATAADLDAVSGKAVEVVDV